MTLQKTVGRNYTTGFPGDIVRDGPYRAKPGRISSATVGTDPGASTNRMSRAFGFVSDLAVPTGDITNAALAVNVAVGAPIFYGVLGNPKEYALYGGASGPLSPTIDLLTGVNASFFDMVTGMVMELYNETTAAKTVNFGDGVAFVPNTITVGNNPLALPYGALVSFPAGGAAPTGMVIIPNARVMNGFSLVASAAGALISGDTIVQLTQ